MLRLIASSYAPICSRVLASPAGTTTFYRSKASVEDNKKNNQQNKSNDPDAHCFYEKKHIHDETKDVRDGDVHVETKDIYEIDKKCDIHVQAHQPDYSGKLWEDGGVKTDEPNEETQFTHVADKELPEAWASDLQDPSVKGEGGDRVLFESKHLHNANLKNDHEIKNKKSK